MYVYACVYLGNMVVSTVKLAPKIIQSIWKDQDAASG